MFKELKVIKLIILGVLFLSLIWKIDYYSLAISDLYTDKISYFPNETSRIYFSSKSLYPYNSELSITGLTNDFKTTLPVEIRTQIAKDERILEDGLRYTTYEKLVISEDFPSGIYTINGKFPLVVKTKKQADIVVVYPAMNNLLYQNVQGENALSRNLQKTSLLRSVMVDKNTRGISDFFKKLEQKQALKYITDLDLEDAETFNTSKVLIIYGKSTFWTPKMKEEVNLFVKNGGNILNLTTYMANDICWHTTSDEIRLLNSTKAIKNWSSQDTLATIQLAGAVYKYAGYSAEDFYTIEDMSHPLFEGLDKKQIQIKGELYTFPPIEHKSNKPAINRNKMGEGKGWILASGEASYQGVSGMKGISIYQQTPSSGKIIVLGTESWCEKRNIGSSIQLQRITSNAISYLLR